MSTALPGGRVLAVRLDSDGDVLLTGPAIRALGALGPVDLLASPSGAAAGRLLPGVEEVLVFDAPWSGFAPSPVDPAATHALVAALASRGYALAVIFTSFHQSPLPMALLARLAGVERVAATSEDYPGSLLDVRHRRADPPAGGHEAEAALALAVAAGAPAPDGPEGRRLAVHRPLLPLPPAVQALTGDGGFVVLHPGASVGSRALTAEHAARLAAGLARAGYDVVVTGGPGERDLVASTVAGAHAVLAPARGNPSSGVGTAAEGSRNAVAGAGFGSAPTAARDTADGDAGRGRADGTAGQGRGGDAHRGGRIVDLAGRTDLPGLAAVLDAARCVVVGNTGPAHLAAAVGTPVVSLFSPVVPAARWAPYGVPSVVLGDQQAPCRDTRARECPVPGHPCLSAVGPEDVVAAVASLLDDDGRTPAREENARGETVPDDAVPREKAPGEKAPGEKAPGEKAPGEKAPGEKTPGEKTPVESTATTEGIRCAS